VTKNVVLLGGRSFVYRGNIPLCPPYSHLLQKEPYASKQILTNSYAKKPYAPHMHLKRFLQILMRKNPMHLTFSTASPKLQMIGMVDALFPSSGGSQYPNQRRALL